MLLDRGCGPVVVGYIQDLYRLRGQKCPVILNKCPAFFLRNGDPTCAHCLRASQAHVICSSNVFLFETNEFCSVLWAARFKLIFGFPVVRFLSL